MYKIVRLCKEDAMSIVPQNPGAFDLKQVSIRLRSYGYDVVDQDVMVIARKDGVEVTMYRSGRLLVHPAGTKDEAAKIADGFYDIVEETSG